MTTTCAGAETLPPFFVGEIAVDVDVHAIVADRIRGDARAAAGAGRNAQAAFEQLEIDVLRPERIAVRIGIVDLVARFAAGFVGDDRVAADIAVGNFDRIDLPRATSIGRSHQKGE